MSREKWVATPYVTEQTGQDIMMGHTGLPVGLDVERIQWNVDALRRGVIGWGGYQALALTAYRGDEDRYGIGGGIDDSGVGYASAAASVSRAESSSSVPFSDGLQNVLNTRNGVLGVGWNINALNSRIETHEQFDPVVRARQLNRAVKQASIKGVWTHNVNDVFRDASTFKNAIHGAIDSFWVANMGAHIYNENHTDAATSLTLRIAVMGLVRAVDTLGAMFYFGDSKNTITDPLLFSCRPTRAALGSGVLAASRLVRAV